MWEIILLVTAMTLAYYYLTSRFSYWRDKGVVFVKPYPLVGSMWKVLTLQQHMSDFFKQIYFENIDQPYVGFYQGSVPTLLIRDAELAKNIMVKDFSHFTDHGFKVSEEADPLNAKNLFQLNGHKWKNMRSKLSPTFTSGRMKSMFPLVHESSQTLINFLGKLADAKQQLELKDVMARYTLNVIASTVFGIDCDSINHPETEFRQMGSKLLETDFIQGLKVALISFIPGAGKILKVSFFKKEATPYFTSLVHDMITLRAKTGKTRKDFLQLLIELKEKGRIFDEKENDTANTTTVDTQNFTEEDILAQAMVFFFAGFETSSSALTYAFFELARQPELQEKARQHIEEVLNKHDGKTTYEALQDMTYLDWILNETLRKYPSLSIFRECTQSYVIPGTKLTIEKGMPLIIPTAAMQMDPKFYPNPDKFDPERFSDEEVNKLNQYIYMPFGEGPRQCIGMRFARMQSKLGLLSVLRQFKVTPSSKTKYPLSWDARQFLLTSSQDVFVNIERI